MPRSSVCSRAACAAVALALACLAPLAARAADEDPDLIFRKSTVFHWVSPNDKLATYGIDDPVVEGVACHFTVPEKGGFKGWIGVAEEVSDISLACRQVGPIRFKAKFEQGDDVFRQRRSLFFKKMQIVRGCDVKRNVLVYMVYSDRLIEGSPKNSTSTVPIMPWGAGGRRQVRRLGGEVTAAALMAIRSSHRPGARGHRAGSRTRCRKQRLRSARAIDRGDASHRSGQRSIRPSAVSDEDAAPAPAWRARRAGWRMRRTKTRAVRARPRYGSSSGSGPIAGRPRRDEQHGPPSGAVPGESGAAEARPESCVGRAERQRRSRGSLRAATRAQGGLRWSSS